jgi:Myb-like DNA-binding domain
MAEPPELANAALDVAILDYHIHQCIQSQLACLSLTGDANQTQNRYATIYYQNCLQSIFFMTSISFSDIFSLDSLEFMKKQFKEKLPFDRLLQVRWNLCAFIENIFFFRDAACEDFNFEESQKQDNSLFSCCELHRYKGLSKAYILLIETVQLNTMDPISFSVLLLEFKTQLCLLYSTSLKAVGEAVSRYFPELDSNAPAFPFTEKDVHLEQRQAALNNYKQYYYKRRRIFMQLQSSSLEMFKKQLAGLKDLFQMSNFKQQVLDFVRFSVALLEKPILLNLPQFLWLQEAAAISKCGRIPFSVLTSIAGVAQAKEIFEGTHTEIQAFLKRSFDVIGELNEEERRTQAPESTEDSGLAVQATAPTTLPKIELPKTAQVPNTEEKEKGPDIEKRAGMDMMDVEKVFCLETPIPRRPLPVPAVPSMPMSLSVSSTLAHKVNSTPIATVTVLKPSMLNASIPKADSPTTGSNASMTRQNNSFLAADDFDQLSVSSTISSSSAYRQQQQQQRKGRVKFSEEETENLIEGYKRYGHQWGVILSHYQFHPHRRPVDLKDKIRNLRKNDLV